MREAFFDLKTNGHLTILKLLFIVLSALLVFHTASFLESADGAIQQSFSNSAQADLYGITDTLPDPDEFSAAISSAKVVASVGSFYNELNTSKKIKFLSIFNQPLAVTDPAVGERFDEGYVENGEAKGLYTDPDTGLKTREVHSFQLNEQAAKFYNLRVSKGSMPDWSSIDYSQKQIPVLLGADYQKLYDLGDVIAGSFAFDTFGFKVVGFLKEASSIYYQGNMNTFLDNAIVVPYPAKLAEIPEEAKAADPLLYFAMIGGDIATPRGESADLVTTELQRAAHRSGFEDYTIMGASYYLTQLQLMRALLVDNQQLLIGTISVTLACLLVIAYALGAAIIRRRLRVYNVQHQVGVSQIQICRVNRRHLIVELVLALTVSISLMLVMPNFTSLGLLFGVGVAVSLSALDAFAHRRQLRGYFQVSDR